MMHFETFTVHHYTRIRTTLFNINIHKLKEKLRNPSAYQQALYDVTMIHWFALFTLISISFSTGWRHIGHLFD